MYSKLNKFLKMYKNIKKYFVFVILLNVANINFSFSNEYDTYFICHPKPEGINFGLIFKDGEVTQLGIENYKFIVDYKEKYRISSSTKFQWLNLTLDIKNFKLHLGKMENHIAVCHNLKNLEKLMKSLDETLQKEMQKNTI